VNHFERVRFGIVDVELSPEQPPEVVAAVADLLEQETFVDPWWAEGNHQALGD
jgi:hypothetical protein